MWEPSRTEGKRIPVTNTVYAADRSQVAHLVEPEEAARMSPGDTISLQLDWQRRFKRMRVHTALHLLSVVLPYPVTGGAISDGDGGSISTFRIRASTRTT